MKRLLIVVPIYGSYRAFLKGLAAWLVECGWEVHVATNLTGAKVAADVAHLHHSGDAARGEPAAVTSGRVEQLTALITRASADARACAFLRRVALPCTCESSKRRAVSGHFSRDAFSDGFRPVKVALQAGRVLLNSSLGSKLGFNCR